MFIRSANLAGKICAKSKANAIVNAITSGQRIRISVYYAVTKCVRKISSVLAIIVSVNEVFTKKIISASQSAIRCAG